MARLEALLKVKPSAEECRQTLNQLAVSLDGEMTWLDPRNACLRPSALPVQVLMELRGNDQLAVMVNSREGMGSGAPLS